MIGTKTLIVVLSLVSLCLSSDVIELDESNFEHETQASTGATTGDWFIKFYAPWCGHCKRLAPTWEDVATDLKGKVNVAKVDVTQNRGLGSRFGIKGFPTLLFFKQGKMVKYSGARSKDALIDFALNSDATDNVPGPQSMATNLLTKFVDVIEQTIRIVIDKPISCIIIAFIGGMVGFLVGLLVGGPSYTPPPPPPAGQSPYYTQQSQRQEQAQQQQQPPKPAVQTADNDDDDDDDADDRDLDEDADDDDEPKKSK